MRILISGSWGFVGSHVIDHFFNKGHEVLGVDNLLSGKRENVETQASVINCDITNWWDIISEMWDFEPDVVVHLAAQSAISVSVDNPIKDAHNNVMGTLNIIRVAQKLKVKRIIFSSTSAVYADEGEDYFEDSKLHPTSPYGISKMACEYYLQNLFPNSIIMRFGNVYGPKQVPVGDNQVIPKMIRHMLFGDEFSIHGDGNQERSFVYVGDVVDAIERSLNLDCAPGIYNIAGENCSIDGIAAILDFIKVIKTDWEHDSSKPDTRNYTSMVIEKANKNLGWYPKTSISDGLKSTVDWWKNWQLKSL